MNLEINKSLITVLNQIKYIICILGIIGLIIMPYNLGKFHGMIQTTQRMTAYEDVCNMVGVYNNISRECFRNCDNQHNYLIKLNNINFCIDERPTFNDRLELLLISGNYIKETDIHIYFDNVGVAS